MSTLDLDTIQKLLGEEKKKDDTKHVPGADAWHRQNFPRRLRYLFDLPHERMFQRNNLLKWKDWQCIACGALVKDRESHFNWHKRELGELT